MKTVKIDAAGRWLRDDAAASYRRMIADGMPPGGIASAGRTYAEQARLYELYKQGKGNLAAKPGTSLHETGLALDITRRTPAQLWATQGGDPMTRKAGESIRANTYGWVRTVPGEAWHFSYDPKRDRKRPQPTLRLGSTGELVKKVQRVVGVTPTGFYGPGTRAAVKRWQAARKLAADGIAGPATLAAMGLAY